MQETSVIERDGGVMLAQGTTWCGEVGCKVPKNSGENESTISNEEGRKSNWGKHKRVDHSLSFSTVDVSGLGANGWWKDSDLSQERMRRVCSPGRGGKVWKFKEQGS